MTPHTPNIWAVTSWWWLFKLFLGDYICYPVMFWDSFISHSLKGSLHEPNQEKDCQGCWTLPLLSFSMGDWDSEPILFYLSLLLQWPECWPLGTSREAKGQEAIFHRTKTVKDLISDLAWCCFFLAYLFILLSLSVFWFLDIAGPKSPAKYIDQPNLAPWHFNDQP